MYRKVEENLYNSSVELNQSFVLSSRWLSKSYSERYVRFAIAELRLSKTLEFYWEKMGEGLDMMREEVWYIHLKAEEMTRLQNANHRLS